MTTTAVPKTPAVPQDSTTITATAERPPAGRTLAVLRFMLGFVFLWAFLDKTFGLGYSTAPAKAWVAGGSPTSGFLGHVDAGPFRVLFNSMAGSTVVDVLFMLGMLAVGVALFLGVGLRLAAAAGGLIMVLMWAAEWPMARLTFDGQPTGSTNPFVDYHLVFAAALVVLALLAAGRTWGLGRAWQSTKLVKRLSWLK
jgi:thiosulfate dehydrogenase [quinone] large subunit